ncbi:MAG: hypothetical protein A2504_16355 [Bdellovibrionales bacterium RIFOXYD12_FULL_39_22]|nr:MAG: hypothetical protein A2385_10010 [Bdellovibrionales bacterium RIFOXYB1_FULL_39_21]OFZ45435.1 MAG: hypothetical protein A2404_01255 [Bdellovibrionales bacterium RIFOXYC1_FULL_39_130]OFZ74638.1 MAG: hypothetical protein A2560_09580 [Bdellovibrionales bacterium RIFOXYD1_FULL_39_84]OFZ92947.1 MAG: hypothetical protein A2504_16355 [Bdellovibrionales bacterium RIFOXYD12_FULL_39_22]HLE12798.1 hypothetical protein [Bacteriovoracaceae bacterium]
MITKTKFFLLGSLVFLLSSNLFARFDVRHDSWQREFIGTPTFRLSDDPELMNKERAVAEHQERLRRAQAELSTLQQEVERIRENLEQHRTTLQTVVAKEAELAGQKNQLQQSIQAAHQRVTALAATIEEQKQALATATAAIAEAQQQVATAEQSVKQSENQLEKVKAELAAAMAECQATATQNCAQTEKVKKAQARVDNVTTKIANQKSLLKLAQDNLVKKENQKNKAEELLKRTQVERQTLIASVPAMKAQIDAIEAQREQNRQKQAQVEQKIATIQSNLQNKRREMEAAQNLQSRAQFALDNAINQKEVYQDELIQRILEVNHLGANHGAQSGDYDGYEISRIEGERYGNQDGLRDGEDDGRTRDYRAGYQEGLKIGKERARVQGEIDGTREGKIRGNQEAASREGAVAGTIRAKNSDASLVGDKQGAVAGLKRAEVTGERVGTPQGEKKAIDQYEAVPLANKEIQGDFAGLFSRNVPNYPGPSYRSYNTNEANRYPRRVVQLAYVNGYDFAYIDRSSSIFYNTIANNYNGRYDVAYNDTYARYYKDSNDAGTKAGDLEAYNTNYPTYKSQYFESARLYYEMNPERSSSEYMSTYKTVEQNSFAAEYERIRLESYKASEQATFNSNIAAQTEKFSAKRFAEVESIYKNFPVLKFVSRSLIDSGISGVAGKDGVFQPGESIISDITVINYGQKIAAGLALDVDGSQITINGVEGNSMTTVKGALKSSLSASAPIGSTIKTEMILKYSLKSNDKKIEGRYFVSAEGLLGTDSKQLRVAYPLAMTGLTTKGQLIFEEKNGLKLRVVNNSSRSYVGPITVTVEADSVDNIITKDFSAIAQLDKAVDLADAEVIVSNDRDLYRPLTFRAKLSQAGVTLGVLDAPLTTMVKAQYIERGDAPVLVVNSDITTRDLLDIVAELGGPASVSVLDTSLESRNAQYLNNGFTNKAIMVLDDGNRSVISKVGNIVEKSVSSSLVAITRTENGLALMEQLPGLVDASRLLLAIPGIGDKIRLDSTNPHRVPRLKAPMIILQATMDDWEKKLAVSKIMKVSATAHLNMIREKITRQNFFNADVEEAQLLQLFNIRMLAEIMILNIAHDKSKGGLFNMGKDPKWVKIMENDSNMSLHKLRAVVQGERLNEQNLAISLLAKNSVFTLHNAFNLYEPLKKEITSGMAGAIEKIRRDMDGSAEEKLKNYDRGMLDLIKRKLAIYTPFVPGVEAPSYDQ